MSAPGQKTEVFSRFHFGLLTAGRLAKDPSPHLEQQIYDGFASSGDQALMQQFHDVPWEDRLAVVREMADLRMTRMVLSD
jgi:exonuclease I